MPIYDDVNNQMKDAMRAREATRLSSLRNIRSAFILALKEDNSATLDDQKCIEVLRRLVKQRKDSIDSYTAVGREDLVEAEKAELAVIDSFLPRLAGDEELRGWIQEAIAATGAKSTREAGKVMGMVMKAHRSEVDGATLKSLTESMLAALG